MGIFGRAREAIKRGTEAVKAAARRTGERAREALKKVSDVFRRSEEPSGTTMDDVIKWARESEEKRQITERPSETRPTIKETPKPVPLGRPGASEEYKSRYDWLKDEPDMPKGTPTSIMDMLQPKEIFDGGEVVRIQSEQFVSPYQGGLTSTEPYVIDFFHLPAGITPEEELNIRLEHAVDSLNEGIMYAKDNPNRTLDYRLGFLLDQMKEAAGRPVTLGDYEQLTETGELKPHWGHVIEKAGAIDPTKMYGIDDAMKVKFINTAYELLEFPSTNPELYQRFLDDAHDRSAETFLRDRGFSGEQIDKLHELMAKSDFWKNLGRAVYRSSDDEGSFVEQFAYNVERADRLKIQLPWDELRAKIDAGASPQALYGWFFQQLTSPDQNFIMR